MPRFAANLSMLFTDAPFLDRFERAAQAGFQAVEFMFPYDFPAKEIRSRLDANGLTLVLHNLPAGDWDAGERGVACQPEKVAQFRSGVSKAIDYASALGVSQLNCLAGKVPDGVTQEQARSTLLENLHYAARQLRGANLNLLIEPVNSYDIPGFFLTRPVQAVALLEELDQPNAFLQYDIYHTQRMQGELAATFQKYQPLIRHVQIADNPGRNEPGTGEIHYPYLFALLDRLGYTGWVGCEYKPATTTEEGLDWLHVLAD